MTEHVTMEQVNGFCELRHHYCGRAFKMARQPRPPLACPYCGKVGEIVDFYTDLVGPLEVWADQTVRTHHKPLTDLEAPPTAARKCSCRHCGENVVLYEPEPEDRGDVCPACHAAGAFPLTQ